jgi:hypothetical protein
VVDIQARILKLLASFPCGRAHALPSTFASIANALKDSGPDGNPGGYLAHRVVVYAADERRPRYVPPEVVHPSLAESLARPPVFGEKIVTRYR